MAPAMSHVLLVYIGPVALLVQQEVDFRYYPDTDSFALYLSPASPGCEGNVDFVPLPAGAEPRCDLDITRDTCNGKSPSTTVVAPHLWGEFAYVENKPPVVISESYNSSADVLDVQIADVPFKFTATECSDVKVGYTEDGKVAAFRICFPSNIWKET
ncbi:hypothetical protein HDU86_001587 [Geranomyces michiganensis]|nr:hypothetical protein HDU86_001587 [Geranomyces michiganensis]